MDLGCHLGQRSHHSQNGLEYQGAHDDADSILMRKNAGSKVICYRCRKIELLIRLRFAKACNYGLGHFELGRSVKIFHGTDKDVSGIQRRAA